MNRCTRAERITQRDRKKPFKLTHHSAGEQLLLLLCGEFVDGGIVVLFAADFAVVFRCRLEQFP